MIVKVKQHRAVGGAEINTSELQTGTLDASATDRAEKVASTTNPEEH
jgi:hypothetical protein